MPKKLQALCSFVLVVCGVSLVSIAAIAVWGAGDGRKKIGFRLDNSDAPSAAFTPDGKNIVIGGYRKISLLSVPSGKPVDRFPADPPDIAGIGGRSHALVAVSPDGKYVASGGGAFIPVRLWDFRTGRLVRSYDTNHTCIRALAFSPDGKTLAAGTAYRLHAPHDHFVGPDLEYEAVYEIWLWDLSRPDSKAARILGHKSPVSAIAFLPHGRHIVALSDAGIMHLWDVATRRELRRAGSLEPAEGARTSESGSRFRSTDSRARRLVGNSFNDQWSLRVSVDGNHIVCGRSVWDAKTLELEYFADGLHVLKDFENWQRIYLKEPYVSGRKESVILDWFAYGYRGALTPDNTRLVVAGPFGLHLRFGKHLLTPAGEKLLEMKTPNGQQLLTGNASLLSVFDVKAGGLLMSDRVFSNGASVFALDVSPDGHYALAAGSGETAGLGGSPVRPDACQVYLYNLARGVSK